MYGDSIKIIRSGQLSVLSVVESDLFAGVADYLDDFLFGIGIRGEIEGRGEGLIIDQLLKGDGAVVVLEDDFPADGGGVEEEDGEEGNDEVGGQVVPPQHGVEVAA